MGKNLSTEEGLKSSRYSEKKIEPPSAVIIRKEPNEFSPHRRRVLLMCHDESLTEQAHKADCDINNIVARYSLDELASFIQNDPGAYLDISDAVDYKTALDIVNNAKVQFDALPSRVRAEFNNNPAEFLEFAQNDKNLDRMVELGLAEKRPEIDPPASRKDIENLGEKIAPKKAPKDGNG